MKVKNKQTSCLGLLKYVRFFEATLWSYRNRKLLFVEINQPSCLQKISQNYQNTLQVLKRVPELQFCELLPAFEVAFRLYPHLLITLAPISNFTHTLFLNLTKMHWFTKLDYALTDNFVLSWVPLGGGVNMFVIYPE